MNAGPDQTVDEGDTVTLAGSATDAEGGTLTYAWTAPSGITLSDTSVTGPTFTAPSQLAANTDYEFTLTVTDDGTTPAATR